MTQEVCDSISSTWRNFATSTLLDHPSSLQATTQIAFHDGLLHPMQSPGIDKSILQVTDHKEGEGTSFPCDGSCPRVELSYSYPMAWFTQHCLSIIQSGEPSEGVHFAHLRRFKNSQWERKYIARVQRLIHCYDVYSLFRCFHYISDARYGEEFRDVGDGHSSLGQGIFKWLVSIRPSHLLYQYEDACYLKPYVPSQFVHQFGYDQLYEGNPNSRLAFIDNLIDSARA